MPNFNIVITAADKASATARKVENALSRVTRPFDEVGKSFKSLGREIGFDKIGKNLSTIRSSAISTARGLGSIVAPLSAITGAASVGGVVALADGWAKVGRSVTYAAQSIGGGTRGLQEIEGAAQLVGVASGEATQGLQSLGDTMQDALYGRNQQALMLFNRLGVGIKRTGDGAVDAEGQFKALAGAISRLKNPQQQNLVAGQFGLTALLPLLRQGPAAMDKLIAKAHEMGLVMSGSALSSATDFANNLEQVEAAGRGLRNELGNALIPAIKPLVIQLSTWISKNRELIASNVGKWAREFGTWVNGIDWRAVGKGITDFANGVKDLVIQLSTWISKNRELIASNVGKWAREFGALVNGIDWRAVGKGITDFANGVKDLVDWMGGWKNAAIAVAVVMNASLIVSVVSLTGTLVKAGAGILTYIGRLGAMEAAAGTAAAANGAVGASALGALGRAGLYGAAAGGGIFLGSKISDAMDGTTFGDKFSHYNTKALGSLLSAVGLKDNRFAQAAKFDGFDQKYEGASPTAGVDAGLQARVVRFFEQQGWSRAQAAGIAANLSTESALSPQAVGDNGKAYGIAQWHPDRQKAFSDWSGKGIQGSSLEDQLKFVQYELTKGNERAAGDMLRRATDPQTAGAIVSSQYEQPKDTQGEAYRRGGLAAWLAVPDGPYSTGAAAKDGTVKVEVELKNAPAGTTASAKTKGNASAAPVRIGYSGVGATM